MKTLVKFLIDDDGNVFAYFPQLNFNKRLYSTEQKTCYAHVGQHGACHIDYAKECKEATRDQFSALAIELKSIGYSLRILNR